MIELITVVDWFHLYKRGSWLWPKGLYFQVSSQYLRAISVSRKKPKTRRFWQKQIAPTAPKLLLMLSVMNFSTQDVRICSKNRHPIALSARKNKNATMAFDLQELRILGWWVRWVMYKNHSWCPKMAVYVCVVGYSSFWGWGLLLLEGFLSLYAWKWGEMVSRAYPQVNCWSRWEQ